MKYNPFGRYCECDHEQYHHFYNSDGCAIILDNGLNCSCKKFIQRAERISQEDAEYLLRQEENDRVNFLIAINEALIGTYDIQGIANWFKRHRKELNGKSPDEILVGRWHPHKEGPQAIFKLAQALTGSSEGYPPKKTCSKHGMLVYYGSDCPTCKSEAKMETNCTKCGHDAQWHDDYSCAGNSSHMCRCAGYETSPVKEEIGPVRLTKESVDMITKWADEQSKIAKKFEDNGDLANARKYYTIAHLMFQEIGRFLEKNQDVTSFFPNLPPNCS